MKKLLIPLCLVALLFCSCDDEDDVNPKESENDFKVVNKRIYDYMDYWYLWNDHLPAYKKGDDSNPQDFFESLLYKTKDHWSYITDNSETLKTELEGTPFSMGYEPYFCYYNGENNVLMIVLHVYKGSPAEKAGLKRGDIVLSINDQELTPKNYKKLYYEEQATFQLGKYDAATNTLSYTNTKLKLKAEIVNADPSICDTIYQIDGKSIGYFAYTSFASNQKYLSSIDAAFDRFREAGVKDLILDLRYNGGGLQSTAGYLASAIAPKNVVDNEKILITNVFNNNVSKDYADDEANFIYRFPKNSHNADMEKVYVLCTKNTASASELIIIGLMPYMDVTVIGEQTYGKYTGMFTFDKRNNPDFGTWAIMPIVCKYANAVGYTDFENGLSPNYFAEDDFLNLKPFGDTEDPMIATALDVINALPLTAKAAKIFPFEKIGNDVSVVRNNLIVTPDIFEK